MARRAPHPDLVGLRCRGSRETIGLRTAGSDGGRPNDFAGAVHEAARVLEPGGHFCFAIVHPMVESGRFQKDGTFLIDRSYLGVWRYPDRLHRRGIEMTFHSEHRPIAAYGRALEEAGFLIEAIREPMPDEETAAALPKEERWRRIPNFLMVRARLD